MTSHPRYDVEDVRTAALGREIDVMGHFGFSSEQLSGQHCPCPKCGGTDRARLIDQDAGAFLCNQCFTTGNGDFIAAIGWLRGWSFQETLQNIAEYLGVQETTQRKSSAKSHKRSSEAKGGSNRPTKPKSPPTEAEFDRMVSVYGRSGSEASQRRIRNEIERFCDVKRPIAPDAILSADARIVKFPRHMEDGHICIELTARFRPGGPPTARLLARTDAQPFEAFGNIPERKTHLLKGSVDGWIVPGGFERLAKSRFVWWVEGPWDAFALFPNLPDGHAVIASVCGAGSTPSDVSIFEGKIGYRIGDCDIPGQDGARKSANKIHNVAELVKLVELPWYEVTETHGRDVRDALNDGHTFEEFLALADAAPAFEPTDDDQKGSDHGAELPANLIRNFQLVEVETDDGVKLEPEPIGIVEIQKIAKEATDDWPRRIGNQLFAPNDSEGIDWLADADGLFSYWGKITGSPPKLITKSGYHNRREIFSHVTRTATSYDAVESQPHEPLISRTYYACEIPESGDGSTLSQLVARYSPETEIDRDLITAAYVTPFCGLAGGARPAFCFTSDAGRGAGKSKLAEHISLLAGGAIDVSANEDIATLKTRLLSQEAMSKRIVLIDNIKTNRLSWAELEALITSPVISGKRMYVGEAQRPNYFTLLLTMNGVSFSQDMAQRSVLVKLQKPIYSGNWDAETKRFIAENHQKLIADILGLLRSTPRELSKFSRWGDWERCVLSRLPNPIEAQSIIAERRQIVDVDLEESQLIEDYFASRLEKLGYNPSLDRVFIPSSVACKWLNWALNEKLSTTKSTKMLKQRIDECSIQRLRTCPSRSIGRGFEFWGKDAIGEIYLQRDLEEAINRFGDYQFSRHANSWDA